VNVRIISQKLCVLAAGVVIMLPSVQLLRGEVHDPKAAGVGSVQAPNPFHIFSSCPPAVCVGTWDGLSDPAAGNTDFRPAGIPVQFSFTTGNPVDYFCNPELSSCTADYNSGTFTATGPAGTFTGVITSGYADEESMGWEIFVTFTGQWSNGQRMTGSADERYSDAFQIPDTTLVMNPAH
jgi:hypothetical protein